MRRIKTLGWLAALGFAGMLLGCAEGTSAEEQSKGVMERLDESYYLQQGESEFHVYAIKDPHCPACSNLRNTVDGGATPNVEWRWVPVGFLGADARADAAEMIENAHSVDGLEAVDSNTRLAQQLGVRSVPTVFYRDTEGQVRAFVGGDPQALEALERMAAE